MILSDILPRAPSNDGFYSNLGKEGVEERTFTPH